MELSISVFEENENKMHIAAKMLIHVYFFIKLNQTTARQVKPNVKEGRSSGGIMLCIIDIIYNMLMLLISIPTLFWCRGSCSVD